MTFFRNFNLRRILSLLLLFVALFSQIQLLYACDSMQGKPIQVCCCEKQSAVACPMTASCSMIESSEKTRCCQVSYDILNDLGVMNTASTEEHINLLLNWPQPPPDIGFITFIHTLFPGQSRTIIPAPQTYLLTRRLRL